MVITNTSPSLTKNIVFNREIYLLTGSWSECSASCGKGFRIRRRICDNPPPQDGGLDCPGCSIDYEICNSHACPEIQKYSAWTPWLKSNITDNEEHTEKRFRFMCKVNVTDANSMKVIRVKEESRVCSKDELCHRVNENEEAGFSDWSPWTTCTANCGGGQQYRTRICERANCEGTTKMARACNTQPCKGKINRI